MKNYLSLFGGRKPLVVENWLPSFLPSKRDTEVLLKLGWHTVRVILLHFFFFFFFVALSFTTDSYL